MLTTGRWSLCFRCSAFKKAERPSHFTSCVVRGNSTPTFAQRASARELYARNTLRIAPSKKSTLDAVRCFDGSARTWQWYLLCATGQREEEARKGGRDDSVRKRQGQKRQMKRQGKGAVARQSPLYRGNREPGDDADTKKPT